MSILKNMPSAAAPASAPAAQRGFDRRTAIFRLRRFRAPTAAIVLFFATCIFGDNCVSAGSFGTSPKYVLQDMRGLWKGDDICLYLDTRRMQANVDAARPFAWEPLTIFNITGGLVIFYIGEVRYIASFKADTMALSSDAFQGSKLLRRAAE